MEIISIIIPIYNTEKYLDRCIKSILNQSYNDLDIILINDGSKDHSLQICLKYSEKDNRIRVFNQINQGQDVARHVGIKNSLGSYIAFIDSDDYVPNNYIEELYNSIMNSKSELSLCEIKCYRNNDNYDYLIGLSECGVIEGTEDIMRNLVSIKGGISNFFCHKLFKKRLLENLPFSKYKKFEDVYLMYQIVKDVKKISFTNKTYYCYMLNNFSTTGSYQSDFKNFDLINANLDKYLYIKQHFPNLSRLSFHQLANAVVSYYINGINSEYFYSEISSNISKKILDLAKEEKYWRLSIIGYMKLWTIKNSKFIFKIVYSLK
ncbi:glycosyltransferase family 2 protein [Merdibacter massiliensis]|uniref:glycosyltransferase family 2 protein n=1 Tax=Merdibacter massiliensis TaxID=1871030 RepID=UPI00096A7E08|nr:glycosyltransferase [Merdibacter massiliensis]